MMRNGKQKNVSKSPFSGKSQANVIIWYNVDEWQLFAQLDCALCFLFFMLLEIAAMKQLINVIWPLVQADICHCFVDDTIVCKDLHRDKH